MFKACSSPHRELISSVKSSFAHCSDLLLSLLHFLHLYNKTKEKEQDFIAIYSIFFVLSTSSFSLSLSWVQWILCFEPRFKKKTFNFLESKDDFVGFVCHCLSFCFTDYFIYPIPELSIFVLGKTTSLGACCNCLMYFFWGKCHFLYSDRREVQKGTKPHWQIQGTKANRANLCFSWFHQHSVVWHKHHVHGQ